MSDKLDSLISASLQKHDPEGFTPTMQDIISSSNYEKRGKERGLINEKTGSAVVVRENGQINMSAGHYAQYKINPSGKSIEQSLESSLITNRRRMTVDELVINDHKFNPQMWELTDFKKLNLPTNEAAIVGNLCVSGSVLTKSWDYNLQRYVLIRRPWRGPLFSNLLNVPAIKSALHIYDPLQVDDEILANSDKGYHVNALISDAKSLIGKEGQDRDGIDRNFQKVFGTDGSASSSSGSLNTNVTISSADMASLWLALKQMGFNEIAAAGLLGCFSGESSGRFDALEGDYLDNGEAQQVKMSKDRSRYAQWAKNHLSEFVNANPSGYDGGDGFGPMPGIGLAQWTGPRAVRLFTISNGEWWTPQAQIKFATDEMNGNYAHVFNKAQGCSSPEDAAKVFAVEYEGGGFTGYADNRAARAREIYDKFAGKK